ncbi:MAG: site-specific integrase [Bacteroidia bacterium]|nr:site-specific integrase [Bacteroidia bacterium]
MKLHYKRDDMFLSELKFEFITGFEYFLKTTRNCAHNSTIKYIKNFRKVINFAMKHGWLENDPFAVFSGKLKAVEREALTSEELATIEGKQICIPRLDKVRDIFVFSCYTGLAYIDAAKLTSHHIYKGIDGLMWINIHRTKTETKSAIPLLPKALEILAKYQDYSEANPKGQLLPVSSNQRMNTYLKELADICGITKNLTFHLARHTFATTVTLTNGVPIESVSSMLGHTSIKTTQIYSKVVEKKVSQDMAALREKLINAKNGEQQDAAFLSVKR